MAFLDIHNSPACHIRPYERQMGTHIAAILRLFEGRVPDTESHARVTELAATPGRWSASHAVFDEIRKRLLRAMDSKDRLLTHQYSFEESCCKALYNATDTTAPFDPSSPFFVVPSALDLARLAGVSLDAIADAGRSD